MAWIVASMKGGPASAAAPGACPSCCSIYTVPARRDRSASPSNKFAGAPSPRISRKACWSQRTSCGFPQRKPHAQPCLGPRSRNSGVLDGVFPARVGSHKPRCTPSPGFPAARHQPRTRVRLSDKKQNPTTLSEVADGILRRSGSL